MNRFGIGPRCIICPQRGQNEDRRFGGRHGRRGCAPRLCRRRARDGSRRERDRGGSLGLLGPDPGRTDDDGSGDEPVLGPDRSGLLARCRGRGHQLLDAHLPGRQLRDTVGALCADDRSGRVLPHRRCGGEQVSAGRRGLLAIWSSGHCGRFQQGGDPPAAVRRWYR